MAKHQKSRAAKSVMTENRRTDLPGVAIVVLLLAAIGFSFFFFIRYGALSRDDSGDKSASQSAESIQLPPMVDIGEFIVNIISEENNHYLKTSITVEVSDQKVAGELTLLMPKIRDAVLMLISNKTFEEIYDLHGKKQLKAELLMEINTILNVDDAVAIYFTDFVVQ